MPGSAVHPLLAVHGVSFCLCADKPCSRTLESAARVVRQLASPDGGLWISIRTCLVDLVPGGLMVSQALLIGEHLKPPGQTESRLRVRAVPGAPLKRRRGRKAVGGGGGLARGLGI